MLLAALAIVVTVRSATAQIAPTTSCDMAGIGSAALDADGVRASIVEVSTGRAVAGQTSVPYCLVKVRVPEAINIWVALPTDGAWNGRLQSQGGGGYAGSVAVATNAVIAGYVGITTDTGHAGSDGSFGMREPGRPNSALQIDFAYRSEHLMAVIGKQLTRAFYGRAPSFSYWNGCSTGGRQGLMMAQRYPDDYEGIVAGAPAIHWDRFQAAQIWPQVVMRLETGGPIASAKLNLATAAAVAACDARDGVTDKVIDDPRRCRFDARTLICRDGASGDTCLTDKEANAINKIWEGPVVGGTRFWFGPERGTPLSALAGQNPFAIAVAQPRYWVYYDPAWSWQSLTYENYKAFFDQTVARVGPVIATDDPNLSRFRDRGGKLILWHGWADPLIMPQGTVDYYDQIVKTLGEASTRTFARLFMAPGVGHCGGGEGPVPQDLLGALVSWVERGQAPDTIRASRKLPDETTRSRPLCRYPEVAVWSGTGSTDAAESFICRPAPPTS
jgi:pimeloyl-ACP methyl ester carboxylesterase